MINNNNNIIIFRSEINNQSINQQKKFSWQKTKHWTCSGKLPSANQLSDWQKHVTCCHYDRFSPVTLLCSPAEKPQKKKSARNKTDVTMWGVIVPCVQPVRLSTRDMNSPQCDTHPLFDLCVLCLDPTAPPAGQTHALIGWFHISSIQHPPQ